MSVVKYHNHMNEISFAKFERKELDLFFSICHKLKEKGTKSIQLDFSELKELSSYTNKDIDAFISDLKSTYDKMLKLDFTIGKDSRNFTKFNLFNEYTVSDETKTVTIATNEKFAYILNEINPYTKFELLEFVSLKSSYSKNLFKKLKQYTRTYEADHKTLFWEVSIDEFRRLLDIPISYRMSEIDKRIFFPALEELKPYFKNLKIQKIKQGKSISKLKFTWLKQYENNDEVIDITISQDLQDAFDKALRNRFIKEVLTEENKYKLISFFEEKELIKGLKYAKDNINKAFKNLSYLENSIKKGLEKPTIQTNIVQTTGAVGEKNIILGEQLSIKTKVTKEEYEECYQEYLKTNNKKNGKEIRASWELSVKNKFEIVEEDEEDKDQFPPENNLIFDKKNKKNEYPSLANCSLETQELSAKLEKKRLEYEKLNNFSREIILSITKLKKEISSAGFFSKKILKSELVDFEKKSQEWHWLFTGLEYKSLSLDHLKQFNELTKYFEDKLGIIVSEIVLEKCVIHIQESPINIEENKLNSDTLKILISIKDIPEEKLLSKNGKKLGGGALISRLKKISKELEKEIQLENGELVFS